MPVLMLLECLGMIGVVCSACCERGGADPVVVTPSLQAAQHHLKNPDIMHKIQTLAGAGIIQLR